MGVEGPPSPVSRTQVLAVVGCGIESSVRENSSLVNGNVAGRNIVLEQSLDLVASEPIVRRISSEKNELDGWESSCGDTTLVVNDVDTSMRLGRRRRLTRERGLNCREKTR